MSSGIAGRRRIIAAKFVSVEIQHTDVQQDDGDLVVEQALKSASLIELAVVVIGFHGIDFS